MVLRKNNNIKLDVYYYLHSHKYAILNINLIILLIFKCLLQHSDYNIFNINHLWRSWSLLAAAVGTRRLRQDVLCVAVDSNGFVRRPALGAGKYEYFGAGKDGVYNRGGRQHRERQDKGRGPPYSVLLETSVWPPESGRCSQGQPAAYGRGRR